MKYYNLQSKATAALALNLDQYEEVKRNYSLCDLCLRIDDVYPIYDLFLQSKPYKMPLNVIGGGMPYGIIEEQFLDLLLDNQEDMVHLGKLFDSKGKEILGYKSFYLPHRIVIRGQSHSTFQKCEGCNRDLYHPLGKKYIVKPVPRTVKFFHQAFNEIVLDEPTYNSKIKGRSYKIYVDSLPLLDHAVDEHDHINYWNKNAIGIVNKVRNN